MPEAIEILGLTANAFAAAAADRGIGSGTALRLYRSTFRTGAPSADWIALPVMPVARSEREAGTTKFVQRLPDGLETESVILPQAGRGGRPRTALCVSSQVGCARGCAFCETAQMGLRRNLDAATIVGQWHAARFAFGATIDNVVFMGMGEPMDNLDAVLRAVEVLTDRNGSAVPASRITISTVGRVDGIERLAAFAQRTGFRQVRLAVSLNAPNDAVRDGLMPINRTAPMPRLLEAMLAWSGAEGRRVLVEYVLIPGVNDASEHADDLCRYLAPLPCVVNVIPYNPRRDSPWPAPDEAAVDRFVDRVRAGGRLVRRRPTLGRAVMAACGQLGNPGAQRGANITIGAEPA